MHCWISGTRPERPCVSKVTGHLFERRLAEKYIAATGTCPATGKPISTDDLIDVIAKPGPAGSLSSGAAGIASVPELLSAMRDEWDAVALEAFSLRERLSEAREELGHSLYEKDAACRVIARLVKERDGARGELSRIEAPALGAGASSAAGATGGDAIPAATLEAFSDAASSLTAARKDAKSRTVFLPENAEIPIGDAVDIDVSAIGTPSVMCAPQVRLRTANAATPAKGKGRGRSRKASHDQDADMSPEPTGAAEALLAGLEDGRVAVFGSGHSHAWSTAAHTGAVTCMDRGSTGLVATGGADAEVQVFKWSGVSDDACPLTRAVSMRHHTAPITGVSFHAAGNHVASCSADGTWSLIDATTATCLTRVNITAGGSIPYPGTCAFHPDGLLLALGLGTAVSLVDLRRGTSQVMTLEGHTGSIGHLAFSQNGYQAASGSGAGNGNGIGYQAASGSGAGNGNGIGGNASGKGDSTVRLWDLRKLRNVATVDGASGPVSFAPTMGEVAVGSVAGSASGGGSVAVHGTGKQWALLGRVGGSAGAWGVGWSGDGGCVYAGEAGKVRQYTVRA